jgi:hypothetical protein
MYKKTDQPQEMATHASADFCTVNVHDDFESPRKKPYSLSFRKNFWDSSTDFTHLVTFSSFSSLWEGRKWSRAKWYPQISFEFTNKAQITHRFGISSHSWGLPGQRWISMRAT